MRLEFSPCGEGQGERNRARQVVIVLPKLPPGFLSICGLRTPRVGLRPNPLAAFGVNLGFAARIFGFEPF